MIIDVIVRGDPDAIPIQYRFQHDDVFTVSADNTKDLLNKGHKININQVILLLAYMVANLAKDGHNEEYIQQKICGLIRSEQVMVGVPEMTRHLEFSIGANYNIVIYKPILYNINKS